MTLAYPEQFFTLSAPVENGMNTLQTVWRSYRSSSSSFYLFIKTIS